MIIVAFLPTWHTFFKEPINLFFLQCVNGCNLAWVTPVLFIEMMHICVCSICHRVKPRVQHYQGQEFAVSESFKETEEM